MPTRRTYLQAWLNGVQIPKILSASCTYGWRRGVPEAIVYVPTNPQPGTQAYNQALDLRMGAGSNNIQRFVGLFRGYSYAMWPRTLGLRFKGLLQIAAEYQNHSDPLRQGGLTLFDLMGAWTATDAAIVQQILSTAGVSYSSGNIGGTGVTWGSRAQISATGPGIGSAYFVWRAGTSTNPLTPLAGAGQTALDYIQQWDAVSAVHTSSSAPVGFYRTFETVHGIYRALIGGRPRNAIDLTFTEGIDIEPNGQGMRDYPLGNAVFVTGMDTGLSIGTVRNQTFDPTTGANTGTFLGQSSNPFQSSGNPITLNFSSPFIEWGSEAENGVGMNCERVGNAMLADINRETVTVRFRTPRDDYMAPGMTMLVQGPGGQPDRLGIGEKLWIDEVTTGVDQMGYFYQDIQGTGGGSPDNYTPAPPF